MKGKGKWALLLLALGIMFAGCFGPSGSSDESAVAAKDNPVLGTWVVTVDPTGSMDISPVIGQAACAGPMGGHTGCLEPAYGWTNTITITDMVVTAGDSVMPWTVAGNTLNLTHGKIIPHSEKLYLQTGLTVTKAFVRGTDYSIYYGATAGTKLGQIVRIGAGIVNGNTVRVKYGYGSGNLGTCPAYGPQGGTTFAECFYVGNYTNKTLEKVRLWTGAVAGAAGVPLLGDTSTVVGRTDYPLLQPQTGTTYAKPNAARMTPVDGWTAGICVNAWGQWSTYSPATPPNVEGCTLQGHPKSPAAIEYAPSWIDPICGRSYVEPWRFSGYATTHYKFYTQLTGNAITWAPDYMATPHEDARNDFANYSHWYAQMAYLYPDDPSLRLPGETWCNNLSAPATAFGWWAGSMVPIKVGSTMHCGTLITDPHLKRGTYFALNMGLEYSDTVEKMGQSFWTDYAASLNPAATMAHGAFYIQEFDAEMIYDNSKLLNFPSTGPGTIMRVRGAGTTMEPLGFVQNAVLTTTVDKSANLDPGVGPHYKNNISWNMGGAVAQFATGGQILVAQYITGLGFSFATTLTAANAYVTQGTKCNLAAGMPIWAGQWGFVHYTGGTPAAPYPACTMTVEAPDNDLDFWAGMMILQVRTTIKPGDFAFLRYDQSESTGVLWHYNSKTGVMADDVGSPCACKDTGYGCGGSCAPAPYPFNYIIGGSFELADPKLPPGEKTGNAEVRAVGCPYGNGKYTCGGHAFTGGVVCAQ